MCQQWAYYHCIVPYQNYIYWISLRIRNGEKADQIKNVFILYQPHKYIYSRDTSDYTIIILNPKMERNPTPFTFFLQNWQSFQEMHFSSYNIYPFFLQLYTKSQSNTHTLQFAHLQFLTSLNFNGISSLLHFLCFLYAVGITMPGTWGEYSVKLSGHSIWRTNVYGKVHSIVQYYCMLLCSLASIMFAHFQNLWMAEWSQKTILPYRGQPHLPTACLF